MYIENVKVSGHELETRLSYIRDFVISPFRKVYKTEEEQKNLPFILLGKEFYNISDMKNFVDKISKYKDEDEPSGYRYIYNNVKRYNECTGLIFTNKKRNYKSKKCISLKSWSYSPFITLDFEVRVETKNDNQVFNLYVNNTVGKFSSRFLYKHNVNFSDIDKNNILNDLGENKCSIIECKYNTNDSSYVYYNLRSDKSSPDEFQDVIRKMQCVADNIQIDEIMKELMMRRNANTPIRERDSIAETPLKEIDDYSIESPLFENILLQSGSKKRKVDSILEHDDPCSPFKKARFC
jgi:hypothetical protein